jgi:predicted lipoprotein with Yx(FWY)xxD motif
MNIGSANRIRVAIAMLAAGALAACGGNTSPSGGNGNGGSEAGRGQGAPAIVIGDKTALGTILTDDDGRTLYLFEKDRPNESACSDACAVEWPPDESTGMPEAGSGVKASLLGMIKRSDGTTQVTYNRHPLYFYSGDGQRGDFNGEGVDAFGAEWFVVSPAGVKVTGDGGMVGGGY